jgi:hypothetical protein
MACLLVKGIVHRAQPLLKYRRLTPNQVHYDNFLEVKIPQLFSLGAFHTFVASCCNSFLIDPFLIVKSVSLFLSRMASRELCA